jgi:hypothetical protein
MPCTPPGHEPRQVAVLRDLLTSQNEADIITFDTHFERFMALSYTRELWAAAYIINGGCSDDGFDYFRGWLIAQGENIFHNALRDPETLLHVAEPGDSELEIMLSVAQDAYERRTGQEIPQGERLVWQLNGELWDEETKYAMYPQLAEKFS